MLIYIYLHIPYSSLWSAQSQSLLNSLFIAADKTQCHSHRTWSVEREGRTKMLFLFINFCSWPSKLFNSLCMLFHSCKWVKRSVSLGRLEVQLLKGVWKRAESALKSWKNTGLMLRPSAKPSTSVWMKPRVNMIPCNSNTIRPSRFYRSTNRGVFEHVMCCHSRVILGSVGEAFLKMYWSVKVWIKLNHWKFLCSKEQ